MIGLRLDILFQHLRGLHLLTIRKQGGRKPDGRQFGILQLGFSQPKFLDCFFDLPTLMHGSSQPKTNFRFMRIQPFGKPEILRGAIVILIQGQALSQSDEYFYIIRFLGECLFESLSRLSIFARLKKAQAVLVNLKAA